MADFMPVSTVAEEELDEYTSMSITRIIFLAKYRVPHACFSMQFDHYLQGVGRTIIATPMLPEELKPVWDRYNINHESFEYLNDEIIYKNYPEVNNWVLENDYRGWWLRQQAIKLAYLDLINDPVMMINDPDTFLIEPYCAWDGTTLNYLALENTTHGSYEGVLPAIVGISRQTNHCFITELVACCGTDIQNLKKELELQHKKNWLDAIIDAVPGMPTIPPWGNGEIIKWFSEYELIGNWTMTQRPVNFQFQRRYEYDCLDNIGKFTQEHNAICDAVPDLSHSMTINWNTLDIPNFNHYLNIVNARLQNIQS